MDSETPASDQLQLLRSLVAEDANYCCPDETSPITRSVHLARLRSHFEKCHICPHRNDLEQFSPEVQRNLKSWWERSRPQQTQFTDGFRGLIHNEFERSELRIILNGFMESLWSDWIQRDDQILTSQPKVVIGHDLHGFSFEMTAVAIQCLAEQGCQVIDIGNATTASTSFLVDQTRSEAGLYLSTGVESSQVGGVDLYRRGGMPLSAESLHAIHKLGEISSNRQARKSGGVIPFAGRAIYHEVLQKYYEQIVPEQMLILSSNQTLIDILRVLKESSQGSFQPELIPVDLERQLIVNQTDWLKSGLTSLEFESVCLINGDGQAVYFYDSTGEKIPALEILDQFVRQHHAHQTPGLILGEEYQSRISYDQRFSNAQIRYRQSLRENFTQGMRTSKSHYGLDAHERYWFAGHRPVCDGIVTVGKVLQSGGLKR
ncbi:hypothetical protein [uncultured Rubinisphaera sp.]|uniref:hypothetical protein n=1 Tax=uncultured Rubinisphaera sp. TaxID=1678686 RepID=UPI0030DC4968